MPLLTGFVSSLHSTRSPATSRTPSTTGSPPIDGLSAAPVDAARTGGNDPAVSRVLPEMELMAIVADLIYEVDRHAVADDIVGHCGAVLPCDLDQDWRGIRLVRSNHTGCWRRVDENARSNGRLRIRAGLVNVSP